MKHFLVSFYECNFTVFAPFTTVPLGIFARRACSLFLAINAVWQVPQRTPANAPAQVWVVGLPWATRRVGIGACVIAQAARAAR